MPKEAPYLHLETIVPCGSCPIRLTGKSENCHLARFLVALPERAHLNVPREEAKKRGLEPGKTVVDSRGGRFMLYVFCPSPLQNGLTFVWNEKKDLQRNLDER